jgi:hypothetical protein
MTLSELSQVRFKLADSLRAVLLGLVARTLGDDFLELVDGTAPSEQRLDSAIWLTPAEEAELETKLDALRNDVDERLTAMGLRGVLYIASDAALLEERSRVRTKLYGASA